MANLIMGDTANVSALHHVNKPHYLDPFESHSSKLGFAGVYIISFFFKNFLFFVSSFDCNKIFL